ncbi:lipopolysaccharide biosynthesis protein [Nocardioides hwasunensis]|uniref:Polysaccharide biosynthesis protein n=1 Tax=Nocardioides hwasunensis TaxID=397258 RepID=A0ABR8MEU3_9ACTN|nr:polysaccharide biosynthesis protein [Nocardioides hwasunensis]MBD3914621.1 polysaccharide biosynthesis protein [Nocardioides hwasunensis]
MPDRAPEGSPGATTLGGKARTFLSGGGQIAVAMMVMNFATYGFTMSAARVIGPASYGAFFALMNLVMIVSVVQLGLQATAARRISADPAHVGQIERGILRVSIRASLLLSGLLLVAAPLVDRLLDLDSLSTAALAAVVAFPMTMMGAQAGILQGERRWRELGILYVLAGVPRLVVGLALILWQPTEFMAFLGVTIGFFAPYLYGTLVLRNERATGETHERHGFLPIIKEALINSQALFAYFALTNTDMLVGRTVLDSHDSGLYAAGLIVARAVMFLPQFVVVVAFPSMATEHGRGKALAQSVGAVTALGVVCTAATAALPQLALIFAGGGEYDEVADLLWLFALLGTTMAVLQLLVYSVLARQGTLSIALVWVALVVMVGIASSMVSTVAGLLTVVLTVEVVLLAVLLAISVVMLRRAPSARAAVEAQPPSGPPAQ